MSSILRSPAILCIYHSSSNGKKQISKSKNLDSILSDLSIYKRMPRLSFWKNLSIEEFTDIVKKSFSIMDIVRKLGYGASGGTHREISNYIKKNRISTIHFKRLPRKIKYKDEELFCENSPYSRSTIKKRILKKELIKNCCSICFLKDFWQNKKIVLVLDHINGISNDNRLENLRFLCPNCNSQTITFAGKNVNPANKIGHQVDLARNIMIESIYKEQIPKMKEKTGKLKTKSAKRFLISKVDLENLLLKNRSLLKTAKEVGCSDNAIKKKCIKMNIDYKKIFLLYPLSNEIKLFYKKHKNIEKTARHYKTSSRVIELHLK